MTPDTHYFRVPQLMRFLPQDGCDSPTPNADLQSWTNTSNQYAANMQAAINQFSPTNLQMGTFAREMNAYGNFCRSIPQPFCIDPSNQADFDALNNAIQNANAIADQGVADLDNNFGAYCNVVTPLLNDVIQASNSITTASKSFQPVWNAEAVYTKTNNRYSVEVWTVSNQITTMLNSLNNLINQANQATTNAESQLDSNFEQASLVIQQQASSAEAAYTIWDTVDGYTGYTQYLSIAQNLANVLVPDFSNFASNVPDSPRAEAALSKAQSAINQVVSGMNSFPDFPELPAPSAALPYTPTYSPNRDFGRPELVTLIKNICISTMNDTGSPLRVNDMSYEHGGYAKPHKSHKNGTDVDVTPVGMGVVPNEDKSIALAAVKRYLSAGGMKIFFADQGVVDDANAWAAQSNIAGRLQFEPKHIDHFHIRI